MVIRQAHPGPDVPPYRDFDQKMRDAERYRVEDGISWPVLVDDLAGTVHQVYGGLADPTYLIDADGRVAYYGMWTHAPNLNEAIAALLRQGGRGAVSDGIDHVVHMLPAMTDGWKGIRRGLPQSYLEMELAVPGSGAALWLGHQARPVVAPLTLRAEPLPPIGRAALALAAVGLAILAVRALRPEERQPNRTPPTDYPDESPSPALSDGLHGAVDDGDSANARPSAPAD